MHKVVIISPTPTHPIDFGNRKRIHRMARELKDAGCHVSFILYPLEGDWRKDVPIESYRAMQEEWDEFHVVVPTVPYHSSAQGDDHELDEWWDPALEKFLWWYLRGRHTDAVIVNYIYLSRALTLAPKSTLKILDTHDRFGGRREMLAQLGIQPEFFHITDWDESAGIRRADVTIAIKPQEEAYFGELGAETTLTLPFSERPIPRAAPAPDPDGYFRIGMIGGRNSINRNSAFNFLESFVPRAFATMAPIKLLIGGTMCADMKPYRGKYCVELLGPVNDVAEFYDQVDAVVVPMEVSTGQKIKVGEAIGRGIPVISTAHAFEGYSASHPLHQLADIDAMVEACIELSFEPSRLPALARASEIAAVAQEQTVSSAMDELVELIAYHKPRSLMTIDGDRFLVDPFFRAHIMTVFAFVKEISGVIAAFTFSERQSSMSMDVENDLKTMRRSARLVEIYPESKDTIASIMESTWIQSVFDYGATPINLTEIAPTWFGLVMECTAFKGRQSAVEEQPVNRPAQFGTDSVFVASIGNASQLAAGTADRRVIPTWVYGHEVVTKGIFDNLLSDDHAAYVFVDRPNAGPILAEIAKQLQSTKQFKHLVLVCPFFGVAQSIKESIKAASSGIKVHHFDPVQPDFEQLAYAPALSLDLSPYSDDGTFLREAFFQMGVPSCRQRHARIVDGIELEPGVGDMDILGWLDTLLTNYQAGKPAPANIGRICSENGYAALYNFLTESFSLLATSAPQLDMSLAKAG